MLRWSFPVPTKLIASFVVLSFAAFLAIQAQPPGFGPGGPDEAGRELLDQFDSNKSGWLNQEERQKARAFMIENPAPQRGLGGPGGHGFGGPGGGPDGFRPGGFGRPGGGPPGMGRGRPEATAGQTVEKSSVAPLQGELYDTSILRTIFIDFENTDWEKELEDFHGSDVDVAATLTVDGKTYPNVGIHFRGMSSYGMVPAGYKRSLNVSMDMADADQRLLGYKTLNLLNGASDESMMSSVVYSHIARQYMPAMKANFVRVVINGEN